jgi:hypothetical protein
LGVSDQVKEATMHPLLSSVMVQQHIDDLLREAAARRLAQSSEKPRAQRLKAPARLRRAHAH